MISKDNQAATHGPSALTLASKEHAIPTWRERAYSKAGIAVMVIALFLLVLAALYGRRRFKGSSNR